MGTKRTAEFRHEAVSVALTSGLRRKRVAADFGMGFSTLRKWVQQDRNDPEKPSVQTDFEREIAELRKENRHHREDMVLLAHIQEQHGLSLNSYGRPRMTEELKEVWPHRRVGRLMRQNGIFVVRTRKHKVTTDSNHKFNIAPNLLNRNFEADRPKKRCLISVISGPVRASSI
jgi:transposase-like protein